MDIDDAIAGAPRGAFELRLLKDRHAPLGVLRRPELDVDADWPPPRRILLKFFPAGAAAEQQGTVLFKLHRFGPVVRQIAQERGAVAREFRQIRVRHTLAHHRRVASRRMKAGNAFLLDQQNAADAAAAQMICSGGASEARADDYDFITFHHATPNYPFIYYLNSR